MNIAWHSFTISNVSNNEIGTKLLETKVKYRIELREDKDPGACLFDHHKEEIGLPRRGASGT